MVFNNSLNLTCCKIKFVYYIEWGGFVPIYILNLLSSHTTTFKNPYDFMRIVNIILQVLVTHSCIRAWSFTPAL